MVSRSSSSSSGVGGWVFVAWCSDAIDGVGCGLKASVSMVLLGLLACLDVVLGGRGWK